MNPNAPTPTVRFAPSPTGPLHLGGARTALFNFLFARQHGGKFILRIDDTDSERSRPENEKEIVDSLSWLGLNHDAFYRQSDRTAQYQDAVQRLIASGQAYISSEAGGKRSSVIRLKNHGKQVAFNDLVRGEISFDTKELGDFVIAKSESEPLYHFASVVDDHTLGITHIIRGEDHISNTPRQILIAEALGATQPIFAHIPLILAPDRSKLSKRHGAVSVLEYRRDGYLAPALINYLALLGWSPQSRSVTSTTEIKEKLSLRELIGKFNLTAVQKGGAIFNQDKLRWLNREYLRDLTAEGFLGGWRRFLPPEIADLSGYQETVVQKMIPLLKERLFTFGDLRSEETIGELTYFFSRPTITVERLKTAEFIPEAIQLLKNIPEGEFTAETVKNALWPYAEQAGRGNVLWPIRMALTGKERSPDPFTIAGIIGKTETLSRLTAAIA